MKLKYIRLFAIIGLLAMPAFSQTNVGGVVLKNELVKDGQKLILNGAGVRKKVVIKIYTVALYLSRKESRPSSIIDGDQPMMIQLNFIYEGAGKILEEDLSEGFQVSTNFKVAPLRNEIDQMITSLPDRFNKDDTLQFMYLPETGVKVYHNGKVTATVNGLEFKKALFGIWLGPSLADRNLSNLKDGMLGN